MGHSPTIGANLLKFFHALVSKLLETMIKI